MNKRQITTLIVGSVIIMAIASFMPLGYTTGIIKNEYSPGYAIDYHSLKALYYSLIIGLSVITIGVVLYLKDK